MQNGSIARNAQSLRLNAVLLRKTIRKESKSRSLPHEQRRLLKIVVLCTEREKLFRKAYAREIELLFREKLKKLLIVRHSTGMNRSFYHSLPDQYFFPLYAYAHTHK